ncbi:MAG: ABC transporter substrate-binding protein [Dehalococcoidia bacterium]|jgi:ABC-type branched-subunit amino acid transport system substrate-binding protein
MKKRFSIFSILIVSIMLLTLVAACAQEQKPAPAKSTGPITINIGVTVPLSGTASPWGQIPSPYREAWFQIFNREGFQVNGQTYNLKLIQVDDENTPEGGSAAAKELIDSDGCKFILAHWTWNFSAIAAVTNPAKVIFMTRNGAPDGVPTSWGGAYDAKTMPYVVFATPSQEMFEAGCFALTEAFPNNKKLGLLDSTVSKDGPPWLHLQKDLDKAGIKYQNEWFPPGTTDFTPIITQFHEAGCNVVYIAGWVGEFMAFLKQRYEMGYKDMNVACSGPFVSLDMYKSVVGADAFEGAIGDYQDNTKFQKTQVNPKYIAECQETLKLAAQTTGEPYEYTGENEWIPAHPQILVQAMQKAGTVDDPDAIMNAIRGGTFDTAMGKWTMSGAQTYGSPIVFGSPTCLCVIKDGKEVYLSEHPTAPIP